MAAQSEFTEDERKKQRNVLIATVGGAFLLPFAGVVGAVLYFMREETRNAGLVLAAAITGAIVYGALFAALS